MKILLVCSAGMSTSILESNMRKYIKSEGIDATVTAMASEDAKSKFKDFSVVLLGPQVRFMEREFKQLVGTTPLAIIPMMMYGKMQGPETVQLAIDTINNG